jgi:hypothetical protein
MRLKKRCDESEAKKKVVEGKIKAIIQDLVAYKAGQENRAATTSTALELTGVNRVIGVQRKAYFLTGTTRFA